MRENNRKPRLAALLLAVAAVLCVLMGSAVAKYIKSKQLEAQVTFTAKLAEAITLQEHLAEKQANGSYALDMTAETVDKNTYVLLPGLDIPKDPHVIITGKTDIEAYLFVEVVDKGAADDALSYALTDEWLLVDGLPGKNGGTVYVYTGTGDAALALTSENAPADPVCILNENQVIVSQTLLTKKAADPLVFYASLGEVAAGTTAAEVYNAIP